MLASRFSVKHGRKVFRRAALTRRSTRLVRLRLVTDSADVAVIIPTMERREIAMCIQTLAASLAAAGLTAHLVVVDQSLYRQNCRYTFEQVAGALQYSAFKSILYYHDVSLTISSAKNKGVDLLRECAGGAGLGQLLVFLDTDIYLTSSCMTALAAALREHAELAAFSFPSVWLRDASQLAWLDSPPVMSVLERSQICKPEPPIVRMGRPIARSDLLQVPAIHGCLLAIKTPVFEAVGGFNDFFGMHGEHVELCARLNDGGHAMAYIMGSMILHDDRAVEQSVTRNLPEREQYLLSTLIAMCARNYTTLALNQEPVFVDLVKSKWLPNIGVPAEGILLTLQLILDIGALLWRHKADPLRMLAKARFLVRSSPLPADVRAYFMQALRYIRHNLDALVAVLQNLEHRMLYSIDQPAVVPFDGVLEAQMQ